MHGHVGAAAQPLLPPAFSAVFTPGDAVERAVALAPVEGAGALVWRLAPGCFEIAVVLEPDRPLREARAAFPVCMAAALDALAAHGPPERPIGARWPGAVRFDGARLGEGRLVAPPCAEDDAPAWLVFGLALTADRDGMADPGREPDATSLREEGFDDPVEIVESFARRLMLQFDVWSRDGLDRAARPYLDRLTDAPRDATDPARLAEALR